MFGKTYIIQYNTHIIIWWNKNKKKKKKDTINKRLIVDNTNVPSIKVSVDIRHYILIFKLYYT